MVLYSVLCFSVFWKWNVFYGSYVFTQLSNGTEAAAVGLSAGLLGVGTYIAMSPAPENIKTPLATIAYISGMIGFALKEALGEQTPVTQSSQS